MNCPRCKIGLNAKQYEDVKIDHCPQCKGIWLDAGELQPILIAKDVNFSRELIEQTLKDAHVAIPKAEVDMVLCCPKCTKSMHSLNYNYSSGVIINACPNGHGLWFDKDELAQVQIYMEHWDEHKNNEKWTSIQKQSRQQENARLNQQEEVERNKTGPIGKAIDAIFDRLREMTGKD